MKNSFRRRGVALMIISCMFFTSVLGGCSESKSSTPIELQTQNSLSNPSSAIHTSSQTASFAADSRNDIISEKIKGNQIEINASFGSESVAAVSESTSIDESSMEQISLSETNSRTEESTVSCLNSVSEKGAFSLVSEYSSDESSKEELVNEIDPHEDELIQSINMLNYLSYISYEIASMKDNPTYLRNIYDIFLDSMSKKGIDNATVEYVTRMYDTIFVLKQASSESDHALFYYEKQKSKALADAFSTGAQSFSGILSSGASLVSSLNPVSLAVGIGVSLVVGVVSGIANYSSNMSQAEADYVAMICFITRQMEDSLRENRVSQYRYQTEILQNAALDNYPELSDKLIADFISIITNKNTTILAKIRDLENRRETYQYLGNYWLELSQLYYSAGEYAKCIDAVQAYEELDIRIFIVDTEYLHVLPFSITSYAELYESNQCSKEEYISYITEKLDVIREKAHPDAWDIRYFAGQFYLEAYRLTNDPLFLHYAYDLIYKNVIALIGYQTDLNEAYLSKDYEVAIPKDSTKENKKIIEAYNKSLRETRKTELPPVYRPLTLNLDFLMDLLMFFEENNMEVPIFSSDDAEPLQFISVNQARNALQRELHDSIFSLFLSQTLEASFAYGFEPSDMVMKIEQPNFVTKTTYLTLSAGLITDNSTISMTISKDGRSTVIDDWKVDEVKRPSDDFDDFVVVYTSESLKDHRWDDHDNISIKIEDKNVTHYLPISIIFKVASGDSPSNPIDTAQFAFQSAYIGTYHIGLKD